MEKKRTPFEEKIVALAMLLHETDSAVQKVVAGGMGKPADVSALKNCLDKLSHYADGRRWEKEYKQIKNSISQGERAVEAMKEALSHKESDVESQYTLLKKLAEKIGTDPSNRDLIKRIEQMQNTITPDTDKTGDIKALQEELEIVMQQRQEKLREEKNLKNLVDFMLVMVLNEQRLGTYALANLQLVAWVQLAREIEIPALAQNNRSGIFDWLGKGKLTPAAQKMYEGLSGIVNESKDEPKDFSRKETRRAAKQEVVVKLGKIARYEVLCREALHEDSAQYKELMEAQNTLLAEGAEKMPLGQMQEKLALLQKAARKYMESRIEKGNTFGVPRREARLVYAAALHKFAQRFSLQLSEAMKYRDIEAMEMPADMTKEYVKNSLKALDMVVREQTGVDLEKEREALTKKPVLENSR